MTKFTQLMLGIVGLAFTPAIANAAEVAEGAINNTLATAQNIDGNFTLDANPNITDSTTLPHATIIATNTEADYDYYSFTVGAAGRRGVFDIDNDPYQFDSFLALYSASGTLLATNDDFFPVDPGTDLQADSYLTYVFTTPGLYALRVGRCCVAPNGQVTGFPFNGPYTLHVSLEAPGVPEPATWALMLAGVGTVGGAVRSRRRTALLTA